MNRWKKQNNREIKSKNLQADLIASNYYKYYYFYFFFRKRNWTKYISSKWVLKKYIACTDVTKKYFSLL